MPLFGGPPNVEKLKAEGNVKDLIKALRYKKDPSVRQAAAEALGQLGDARAVKPLIVAIRWDRNHDVCQAAAKALEMIGTPAVEPLLTALKRAAQEGNQHVFEAATKALENLGWQPDKSEAGAAYWVAKRQWDRCVEIGLPAVAPLSALLRNADANVRKDATKTLGQIGDAQAVGPLIAILADEDEDVGQAAAGALEMIGAAAVELLITALKDENWQVRAAAAGALGEIGDPRAVEPLIVAMKEEALTTVQAANAILSPTIIHGGGGDVDVKEMLSLITAYKDARDQVRRAAAKALGQIGDPRALEPLVAVLKENKAEDLGEAATVVAFLAPQLVTAMTSGIGDASALAQLQAMEEKMRRTPGLETAYEFIFHVSDARDQMTQTAIDALGKIGAPRAVELLIVALKDSESHVRENAARAFGEIGDPQAVEQLIAALKGGDKDVRKGAAGALGKIGDPQAVEPLIAALEDEEILVRLAAAETLGQIGDPRAVEPLVTVLKKGVYGRAVAARALGHIGDERAVEPLITAPNDKEEYVHKAAAEALEQIGSARAIEALSSIEQSVS